MRFRSKISSLCTQIASHLHYADEKKMQQFLAEILDAKRIFLVGAGRSGLVARAFAMRLMHIGRPVFVVGEIVTPAIGKGDLLIVVSGSGVTGSVVHITNIAKSQGARIAAVTSVKSSPIGKLANVAIIVHGGVIDKKCLGYTASRLKGTYLSSAPLGSLFELSCHVLFDVMISELMERTGMPIKQVRERHTNLE